MLSAELQSYAFIVWMILSMIAFVGIIVWSMLPRHRKRFESYGEIPLRDDEKGNRR